MMDTLRTKENQPGHNGEDDNYLFFSSLELIDYFVNNLADKDIRTQTKRILEMARVLMRKKILSWKIFIQYSLWLEISDLVPRLMKSFLYILKKEITLSGFLFKLQI